MKNKNLKRKRSWKKRLMITGFIILSLVVLIIAVPSLVMAKTPCEITMNGQQYNLRSPVDFVRGVLLKKDDRQAPYFWGTVGERWLTGALQAVNACIPAPRDSIAEADYLSENFLKGNDSFGQTPGESWKLGYAQRSIAPDDIPEKTYYVGGNISLPAQKFKSVLDDVKVRTICLDDGTGRGIAVFAAVDCIGIPNRDVRTIRAHLSDLIAERNIVSLNIFGTHVHSNVDTTGIWTNPAANIVKNWFLSIFAPSKLKPTVDEDYLSFMFAQIEASVKEAVENMESGELLVSHIGEIKPENAWEKYDKMIGFDPEKDEWDDEIWGKAYRKAWLSDDIDYVGISDYMNSRRSPYEYSRRITKIEFIPASNESRGTVLLQFAAHPYANGMRLKDIGTGDYLSGDLPYYMEKTVNEAGSNFIFINGAIAGIYPDRAAAKMIGWDEDEEAFMNEKDPMLSVAVERLGRDLASIGLAMTMTQEEINANPITNPEGRTWGYRDTVRRMAMVEPAKRTRIAPLLNIAHQEIYLPVSNPLMSIVGKLKFANLTVLTDAQGALKGLSEMGYMELGGGAYCFAMMPGEITQGLIAGDSDTTAQKSFSMQDFAAPSLNASAGKEIMVLGLANDAIGYVIPDNDYCMFYLGNGDFTWKYNYTHYQELLSLGKHTASKLMLEFAELLKSVRSR